MIFIDLNSLKLLCLPLLFHDSKTDTIDLKKEIRRVLEVYLWSPGKFTMFIKCLVVISICGYIPLNICENWNFNFIQFLLFMESFFFWLFYPLKSQENVF